MERQGGPSGLGSARAFQSTGAGIVKSLPIGLHHTRRNNRRPPACRDDLETRQSVVVEANVGSRPGTSAEKYRERGGVETRQRSMSSRLSGVRSTIASDIP